MPPSRLPILPTGDTHCPTTELMDDRIRCSFCGYQSEDPDRHPSYSADHACYWCPGPKPYSVQWCYHCTMVSIHEQPWWARLFRLPAVHLNRLVPMDELLEDEVAQRPDPEVGTAHMHLLRLVWHCLLARVEKETDEADEVDDEAAFAHAMAKLDPPNIARLMAIVGMESQLVSLERSLYEGIYRGRNPTPWEIEGWLARSDDRDTAAQVREIIDNSPWYGVMTRGES